MLRSLFSDVVAQYVDADGKTRVLQYELESKEGEKFRFSLFTSPLPPLAVPADQRIYRIETAAQLAEVLAQKRWRVVAYNPVLGSASYVDGVWVAPPSVAYGFLSLAVLQSAEVPGAAEAPPARGGPATPYGGCRSLENAGRAKQGRPHQARLQVQGLDPVSVDADSRLAQMRRAQQLARILEQYVLLLYASDPGAYSARGSYAVVPGYVYDLAALDRALDIESGVMFRTDGGRRKLIVPSDAARVNLDGYLATMRANDPAYVAAHAPRDGVRQTIPGYFRSVADFAARPNTLIFSSRAEVAQWTRGKAEASAATQVHSTLRPDATEPYFYRNCKLKVGRLAIIQNVRGGDRNLAVYVAQEWRRHKINRGFAPLSEGEAERESHGARVEVYGQSGLLEGGQHPSEVSILAYGPDTFAALLFT